MAGIQPKVFGCAQIHGHQNFAQRYDSGIRISIFAGGKGRADILAWSEDGIEAIEVVHTEDETKSGKEKYPCSVRFIYTGSHIK